MTDNAPSSRTDGQAFYANFPPRLNALTIDSLVLIVVSALVLTVAAFLQQMTTARVCLFIAWWLILFLYEPFLVWQFGGTVGHRLMNLQVVDNRTLTGLSAFKALTRYVVKLLLGIFSFLSMSLTRRHQAVHDLVTNSSVRIRDPNRAQPHQYTAGPA